MVWTLTQKREKKMYYESIDRGTHKHAVEFVGDDRATLAKEKAAWLAMESGEPVPKSKIRYVIDETVTNPGSISTTCIRRYDLLGYINVYSHTSGESVALAERFVKAVKEGPK